MLASQPQRCIVAPAGRAVYGRLTALDRRWEIPRPVKKENRVEGARVRCVLDCMKIVRRLLVAMAIRTVGLVQVSLAAESNDVASAYHRAEAVNESSNA